MADKIADVTSLGDMHAIERHSNRLNVENQNEISDLQKQIIELNKKN
jgi:hypothetical protein